MLLDYTVTRPKVLYPEITGLKEKIGMLRV